MTISTLNQGGPNQASCSAGRSESSSFWLRRLNDQQAVWNVAREVSTVDIRNPEPLVTMLAHPSRGNPRWNHQPGAWLRAILALVVLTSGAPAVAIAALRRFDPVSLQDGYRLTSRYMAEPRYTVKALDETTWPAFAALVEHNNGVFGGCWCMGFHPEGVGKDTTPALNRERKLDRVRAGTAQAALVFEGEDCVGWCQFGPPDELPRIKSRSAYEKGRTTSPDWRIACCYAGKGHRREGVATAALAGAIDLIAGLGGGVVEGYPEDAGSVPAGFLFNGALSTYEKHGFSRARKIGKHRWVVTRVVAPA